MLDPDLVVSEAIALVGLLKNDEKQTKSAATACIHDVNLDRCSTMFNHLLLEVHPTMVMQSMDCSSFLLTVIPQINIQHMSKAIHWSNSALTGTGDQIHGQRCLFD